MRLEPRQSRGEAKMQRFENTQKLFNPSLPRKCKTAITMQLWLAYHSMIRGRDSLPKDTSPAGRVMKKMEVVLSALTSAKQRDVAFRYREIYSNIKNSCPTQAKCFCYLGLGGQATSNLRISLTTNN